MNLMNALLNTILVSIPEETFLTCMTLILLKRFDFLDTKMWKQNLKWLMIPILIMALDINITKYILLTSKLFTSLGSLLLFIACIIYIIKKNSYHFSKKDFAKTIVCILLSFVIFSFLEGVTCPLIMLLMNKTLAFFNNNIYWNFVLSLPSRIFGFMLITYLIIRQNNVIKIRLFEVISKNKFLLRSIISFAIISNIFSVYILKLIGFNKILENKVPLFEQTLIIMSVLIIPAIIVFWMLLLINYLLVKEKQIQQTYENLVIQDDVIADVENN